MSPAAVARSVHAIGVALAGAGVGDAAQMGFKAANLARMEALREDDVCPPVLGQRTCAAAPEPR